MTPMCQRLKRYMLENYYTHTEEWLVACVEWIESNFNNVNETVARKQVYEQWIDANLEEMTSSCFPVNLAAQKCLRLSGKYGVQLNSIQDIGESAYNQWKQIKKLENENVHVTAASNTDNLWAPKPRRCLYLTITDGSQQVFGLELSTIQALTLNCKPGLKLLLLGPIECRRGVLQLQPTNIRIIGGEVESLTGTHNVESLLGDRLNIPRNNQNENGLIRQPIVSLRTNTAIEGDDGFPDALDDEDDLLFMEIDENLIQGGSSNTNITTTNKNQSNSINTQNIADQNTEIINTQDITKFQPPTISSNSSKTGFQTVSSNIFKSQTELVQRNGKPRPKQLKIDKYMKPMPVIIKPATPVRTNPVASTSATEGIIASDDDALMDIIEGSFAVELEKAERKVATRNIQNSTILNRPIKSTGIVLPIINSPKSCPIKVPSDPYIYLKHIKENLNRFVEKGDVIYVKACITTVIANITVVNDAWTLTVSLSDGTDFLYCKVSSDLLNKILGFDPGTMKQLKSLKTPAAKQQIKQGMQDLTTKLLHLNAIFGIQLKPEPLIVNFCDVLLHHISAMKQRISVLNHSAS